MAANPLLGIFLIGIIFSSSMTAGYNQVVEPLSGRTLSLFNLLPFQRLSSLQNTALISRVATLESNLASLTSQIAASAERCPLNSLGSQLIGTYCYSVRGATVGNQLGFLDAQTNCQVHGGSLAEPLVNRAANKNLYNALRVKFLQAFTTIEASTNGGKFWIGYYSPAGVILSVSTSDIALPVINDPQNLLPTPPNTSGILLLKPDDTAPFYWGSDTYVPATNKYPYICQFTALA